MAIAYVKPQIISRGDKGKGGLPRSAVACAAYRAGDRLNDERYGKEQDYTGREGVLAEGLLLPKDAPDWMHDRGALWNAVERREDRSTRPDDAQLAREMVIALPHELDDKHREFLIKNIGKEATRAGMVFDYAIHAPDKEGDNRNYHAHAMLTMRVIDPTDPDGFGAKNRDWNKKDFYRDFTNMIERETNKMLERSGLEERIKFEIDDGRTPQKHQGPQATALERQGVETDIGNENREIRELNAERAEELRLLRDELTRLHQKERDIIGPEPERTLEHNEHEHQATQERERIKKIVAQTWDESKGDKVAFFVGLDMQHLDLVSNKWGGFSVVSEQGQFVGINGAGGLEHHKDMSSAIEQVLTDYAGFEVPTYKQYMAAHKELLKVERDESKIYQPEFNEERFNKAQSWQDYQDRTDRSEALLIRREFSGEAAEKTDYELFRERQETAEDNKTSLVWNFALDEYERPGKGEEANLNSRELGNVDKGISGAFGLFAKMAERILTAGTDLIENAIGGYTPPTREEVLDMRDRAADMRAWRAQEQARADANRAAEESARNNENTLNRTTEETKTHSREDSGDRER